MLVNESPQGIHVGGHSPVVDAHDRPGLGRNRVSDLAGVDVYVPGSMSTNTGAAPTATTAVATVIHVAAGMMTSSPGSTPTAFRASSMPIDPGGHRHAVPCVLKRGEGVFKSPHPRLFPMKLRTCPGPALQHALQCPLVAFIVHRPGYLQRRINERRSTGQASFPFADDPRSVTAKCRRRAVRC